METLIPVKWNLSLVLFFKKPTKNSWEIAKLDRKLWGGKNANFLSHRLPLVLLPQRSSWLLGFASGDTSYLCFPPTSVSTHTSSVVSPLSVKKAADKNGGQFHHLHTFSYIIYPGQMNRKDGGCFNLQWKSCLSILGLKEKIAPPPTDYTDNIMTLHILFCGKGSGVAVSWYTGGVFIHWLIYSADHYLLGIQSTALAWLSDCAMITMLEIAKSNQFPHSISLLLLWYWCQHHNFMEGWNDQPLISIFLASACGSNFTSGLSKQLHIGKTLLVYGVTGGLWCHKWFAMLHVVCDVTGSWAGDEAGAARAFCRGLWCHRWFMMPQVVYAPHCEDTSSYPAQLWHHGARCSHQQTSGCGTNG